MVSWKMLQKKKFHILVTTNSILYNSIIFYFINYIVYLNNGLSSYDSIYKVPFVTR